jgi:hypothetical protein
MLWQKAGREFQRFFPELRRRNVYKLAVAYAVASPSLISRD